MSRSKNELLRIREEIRLAAEKEFGLTNINVATFFADELSDIKSETKRNFLRRKIGHLYETGRNDYVDLFNLFEVCGEVAAAPATEEVKTEVKPSPPKITKRYAR